VLIKIVLKKPKSISPSKKNPLKFESDTICYYYFDQKVLFHKKTKTISSRFIENREQKMAEIFLV
jgi:hypothetical protein